MRSPQGFRVSTVGCREVFPKELCGCSLGSWTGVMAQRERLRGVRDEWFMEGYYRIVAYDVEDRGGCGVVRSSFAIPISLYALQVSTQSTQREGTVRLFNLSKQFLIPENTSAIR